MCVCVCGQGDIHYQYLNGRQLEHYISEIVEMSALLLSMDSKLDEHRSLMTVTRGIYLELYVVTKNTGPDQRYQRHLLQ